MLADPSHFLHTCLRLHWGCLGLEPAGLSKEATFWCVKAEVLQAPVIRILQVQRAHDVLDHLHHPQGAVLILESSSCLLLTGVLYDPVLSRQRHKRGGFPAHHSAVLVRGEQWQKCLFLQDLKLGFSENSVLPMLHQVLMMCNDAAAIYAHHAVSMDAVDTRLLKYPTAGCNAAVCDHDGPAGCV